MAKKLYILLVVIFSIYLIATRFAVNELCKYRNERPGITVFFQYDIAKDYIGVSKIFEADIKKLKRKLDKQPIEHEIGESGYALTASTDTYYHYQAHLMIVTKDSEVDKMLQFLDMNHYQHSAAVILKSTHCDYKPGYNQSYWQ